VAVQRRTGVAPERSLRAHREPSARCLGRRQCGRRDPSGDPDWSLV